MTNFTHKDQKLYWTYNGPSRNVRGIKKYNMCYSCEQRAEWLFATGPLILMEMEMI